MRTQKVSVGWFPLVFLSGAAALIYQVAWQRYLGILLGTQSKSVAIVLAIFLGGMSLGYFSFGRFTRNRRWNPLIAFSVTESLLAFWGLFFPLLFKGAQAMTAAYYVQFGVQSSGIDIVCALLLLGPPTFLMGGTLPLLTQGLSADAAASSRLHALVYGWNTIGAAFGAWLAGYFLIPRTDLPVTVSTAALFNTCVAGVSYFGYARTLALPRKVQKKGKPEPWDRRAWVLLGTALVSGFCVFTLENVFVRLVGLATGPSQTGFTLVVSIFVLALGLGSLGVRRVGTWSERNLLWNLLAVSTALLALYFTADYWPYWVYRIRVVFRDIPATFPIFQVAIGTLFFLLFLLPIALCGLTLPLCFHLLKEKAETLGDRVGRLYAFNAVGCILGALGGYWLLTFINLDQLFRLCALLFLVCAVGVLSITGMRPRQRGFQATAVWIAWLVIGLALAPDLDRRMALQSFRQTRPMDEALSGREGFARTLSRVGQTIFYKDGPDATVAVVRSPAQGEESSRSVIINGKSDGSTGGDRLTMSLSGHLPGLLAPGLERACVIGLGTGVTVGELSRYSENKTIDVVEISGTLAAQRALFDPYNGAVSKNPKVTIHEMDAFRFLAAGDPYDVIVSEPSNPWVAGVENLFTTEYYQLAKKRLKGNGVFVQWLQLYSFEDVLVRRVLATLLQNFNYVRVFKMLDSDIALVASQQPLGPQAIVTADRRWTENPAVASSLRDLGISSVEVALGLEILSPPLVFVAARGASIYHLDTPRLSHDAARAQYLGKVAPLLEDRRKIPTYGLAQMETLLSQLSPTISFEKAEVFRRAFCEHPVSKSRLLCNEVLVYEKFLRPEIAFERMAPDVLTPDVLMNIELMRMPGKTVRMDRVELSAVHSAVQTLRGFTSALAPLPTRGLEARLDVCLALNKSDARLSGECLIEKIALLEFSRPGSDSWGRTVDQYRTWFAVLPPSTPDYAIFADVARALKGGAAERGIASGK